MSRDTNTNTDTDTVCPAQSKRRAMCATYRSNDRHRDECHGVVWRQALSMCMSNAL